MAFDIEHLNVFLEPKQSRSKEANFRGGKEALAQSYFFRESILFERITRKKNLYSTPAFARPLWFFRYVGLGGIWTGY